MSFSNPKKKRTSPLKSIYDAFHGASWLGRRAVIEAEVRGEGGAEPLRRTGCSDRSLWLPGHLQFGGGDNGGRRQAHSATFLRSVEYVL